MDTLTPKDHAEAVAIFRSEIVGSLTRRELDHGELRQALRDLSQQHFRPPGLARTRAFSVPTLERWYYAYKARGLDSLRPAPRSDRGRAQELAPEARQLLLDIRREHRGASVPLILRTLVADGRLQQDAVSAATVRRLFVEHGLDRIAARDGEGAKTRLRWEASAPGALWHGDVCYGPALKVGKQSLPLRIHALLDDASRYVVALQAFHNERELDMLALLVGALRRHGTPDVLYLDNGSTYRGDVLRVGCARLGISLLHAQPYDAPARGKMERFWRSLREGCLDFLGSLSSLHDVNVRLFAWLDEHYHRAPHGGLIGKTPKQVFEAAPREPDSLDDQAIADALTVRVRRRVRRDTTVSVEGRDWELDLGFLAGRVVTIAYSLIEPDGTPWLEYEGKRRPLHALDPVANSRRQRPPRRPKSEDPAARPPAAFDPAGALLDRATHRRPQSEDER